jgi:hypothetical protein
MIETITNHYRYPLSIVGSLAAVAIQRGFNSDRRALALPPTDPNTPPDVLSLAAWRETPENSPVGIAVKWGVKLDVCDTIAHFNIIPE